MISDPQMTQICADGKPYYNYKIVQFILLFCGVAFLIFLSSCDQQSSSLNGIEFNSAEFKSKLIYEVPHEDYEIRQPTKVDSFLVFGLQSKEELIWLDDVPINDELERNVCVFNMNTNQGRDLFSYEDDYLYLIEKDQNNVFIQTEYFIKQFEALSSDTKNLSFSYVKDLDVKSELNNAEKIIGVTNSKFVRTTNDDYYYIHGTDLRMQFSKSIEEHKGKTLIGKYICSYNAQELSSDLKTKYGVDYFYSNANGSYVYLDRTGSLFINKKVMLSNLPDLFYLVPVSDVPNEFLCVGGNKFRLINAETKELSKEASIHPEEVHIFEAGKNGIMFSTGEQIYHCEFTLETLWNENSIE